MSYRKIEVDGEEYEYVVGKTHLKIRGLGVVPKEQWAKQISIYEEGPIGRHFVGVDYRVTPECVKNAIKWHNSGLNAGFS